MGGIGAKDAEIGLFRRLIVGLRNQRAGVPQRLADVDRRHRQCSSARTAMSYVDVGSSSVTEAWAFTLRCKLRASWRKDQATLFAAPCEDGDGGARMKTNSTPPTTSLGFGITPRDKGSKPGKGDNEQSASRKAKVLDVDEDPALRRLMVSRLGSANYAVDTVDTAQAALDACVLSRPNLVITDLRLADAHGLTFLKELKSRWPHLTVK